jgi:hypothetical protein
MILKSTISIADISTFHGLLAKLDLWNLKIKLKFLRNMLHLLVTVNVVPSLLILFTLTMEATHSPKHRFSHKTYGITSQETAFFTYTQFFNLHLVAFEIQSVKMSSPAR